MYDYLLVLGPGRSGSEFLYRLLREHPSFVFPEIKERYYYRSPAAFRRARSLLNREPRQLLCDIPNLAWADNRLSRSVEALNAEGPRILFVLLLRDHRERAISMIQFRKSRGELSSLFGARFLERAVLRGSLTPERLETIFRTDVDVLTLTFPALVGDTDAVLGHLTSLCAVPPFDHVPRQPVNQAVRARFLWLSVLGNLLSPVLRFLGFRRTLQRIKEDPLVNKVFFVPLPEDAEKPRLSPEAITTLDAATRACHALVASSSLKLREGVYLRVASPPAAVQKNGGGESRRGHDLSGATAACHADSPSCRPAPPPPRSRSEMRRPASDRRACSLT